MLVTPSVQRVKRFRRYQENLEIFIRNVRVS